MALDRMHYMAAERLRNGLAVTVRAVRPDDKARLQAAFLKLDPASVYTRLFAHKAVLTDDDLRRLTEIDFDSEVALVVTLGRGKRETVIGSGRYFVFPHGSCLQAEIAFLVEEDYQGQGMAGLILHHLTVIARDQGIRGFEADVLPSNKAMQHVFARCGLPVKKSSDGELVHFVLDLTEPAA